MKLDKAKWIRNMCGHEIESCNLLHYEVMDIIWSLYSCNKET